MSQESAQRPFAVEVSFESWGERLGHVLRQGFMRGLQGTLGGVLAETQLRIQALRAAPPQNVAASGPAEALGKGSIVHYKQGRGEFEARIVAFDAATRTVTLERLRDGRRVKRPAARVYAKSPSSAP